uniref:Glycoprotein-N-acetylgalactosamine 3-beta-galactosyltransferase 1 n=1 Tax=Macrostomum lignano TaxID=282301 RepID=A0A1I8F8R7_9PLAT
TATNSGQDPGGLMYIYEHYLNDYDFFLKADDDCLYHSDNLRYFLRNTKATEPGRRSGRTPRMVTCPEAAATSLSRAAVKALVEKGLQKENNFCRKHGGAEDVNMGNCLENVAVSILDSIDEKGRERFHPFDAASHIDYANWPQGFLAVEAWTAAAPQPSLSLYIRPVDMLTCTISSNQLRAYGVSADSVRQRRQRGAAGEPFRCERPRVTGTRV